MADVVKKYRAGFSGPYFDDPKHFYDTYVRRGDTVVKIHQVTVNSGDRVDGLLLTWKDFKGVTRTSDHIGGDNGTLWPPWPEGPVTEPIIAIRGKLGEHGQHPKLRLFSIQFSTANSTSQIYGDQTLTRTTRTTIATSIMNAWRGIKL